MTNAYHAIHAAILSAFQSPSAAASPSPGLSPATVATALTDLFAFTMNHALPWVVAFVGTLGSLVTDPDRLLLWLDYDQVHQYVRDHLTTIASVLMALILVWMAWQALWAVQRIVRVVVSVTVKLVVAGTVLAVVWNVYTAATSPAGGASAGAGGSSAPASGRYAYDAPRAATGEYAYVRGAGNGFLDQVFSTAKDHWLQQRSRNQANQQDEAAGSEYSYAWAGQKYRNRREAELDNGL